MLIWANRLYPKTPKKPKPAAAATSTAEAVKRTAAPIPSAAYETHIENKNVNGEYRVSQTTQTANTEQNAVTYHTEISVEVVNHNQIRGEEDMARLAERFTDTLYQTLASSAEGVYA